MSEKEASFDLYRKENYIMCISILLGRMSFFEAVLSSFANLASLLENIKLSLISFMKSNALRLVFCLS